MRSWRNALDNIYYHNAYRVPANYRAKNETERALHESLRDMEMQCKERVDLLEALRKSREEGSSNQKLNNGQYPQQRGFRASSQTSVKDASGVVGQGTIPAVNYPQIARPTLPPRPTVPKSTDSYSLTAGPYRSHNLSQISLQPTPNPWSSSTAANVRKSSRTPSPEKKASGGLFKTTLRPPTKDSRSSASKGPSTLRSRPPAAAKAATLAWPGAGPSPETTSTNGNGIISSGRLLHTQPFRSSDSLPQNAPSLDVPHRPILQNHRKPSQGTSSNHNGNTFPSKGADRALIPPAHRSRERSFQKPTDVTELNGSPDIAPAPSFPSYRKEFPPTTGVDAQKAQYVAARMNANLDESTRKEERPRPRHSSPHRYTPVPRKAVGNPLAGKHAGDQFLSKSEWTPSSDSVIDDNATREKSKQDGGVKVAADFAADDQTHPDLYSLEWDRRVKHLMKHLPKGVDEQAAKAIFNEIVIKGDEVHWDDVAGLDIAKGALKEAVVYPFLRPDLFLGLREPARGMLLFGPPGTGKTMLARAVATESKSTFFAISASSLTSKFLGESEKLVRALFAIAKSLTPSIIFVDEIDSLLSARAGSGEHEATRRIKTEFLIQWSDLAKAAAGREEKDKNQGDASRVLVLAATNMPWAIDEAARRRFVRRQYIPLPEPWVRESQLRRLMGAQKHGLKDIDFAVLVQLTDGGSAGTTGYWADD